MIKKIIPFLLVFLTACSPALDSPPTATPSVAPAASRVEVDGGSDESEQAEKISPETYLLTAAFHWIDADTSTNIMYTYQIPFVILPDGQLQAAGEPMGASIGDAGVRVEDCVEAKSVTMEFSFELLGRKMEAPIDQIDPGILMTAPDLIKNDRMTVLDLALVTPDVTSFQLEPYTVCMEDMDQEFAQALLTFWLTFIPDLPSQYHLIPAEIGTYCTEPLSFVEEGLGELTPCYTISRPQ